MVDNSFQYASLQLRNNIMTIHIHKIIIFISLFVYSFLMSLSSLLPVIGIGSSLWVGWDGCAEGKCECFIINVTRN